MTEAQIHDSAFGSPHWCEGGNAVTNFAIEQFHLYREAIHRYGGTDLYIGKSTERGVLGWFALRTRRPGGDLSVFWHVFDRVRTEEKDAIAAARSAT